MAAETMNLAGEAREISVEPKRLMGIEAVEGVATCRPVAVGEGTTKGGGGPIRPISDEEDAGEDDAA